MINTDLNKTNSLNTTPALIMTVDCKTLALYHLSSMSRIEHHGNQFKT